MKKYKYLALATMGSVLVISGCGADKSAGTLDPKHPVTVTVWNYYSGDQLDGFNRLVEEFNSGKGSEIGVYVEAKNQGSVDDLNAAVLAAAEKKVGSEEVPNMFQAYTDTAYEMDQRGLVQDLSSYLTDEEKSEYIEGYLKEGEFSGDGTLKIFPIAKATEIFVLNETDWDKFAEATGADKAQLSTIEGLIEIAQKYYEWTDSLTEEPDDGKAFFGRDAMANYMLVGAKQLGEEIISRDKDGNATITFSEPVARKLWDNYYVPFLKGYFSAMGRFRSDDLKTGNVLAYVGSTSSATFTPTSVTLDDNTTYDIETGMYMAPEFADTEKIAVQQGAGMVVAKGTPEEVQGSVEFLKWFTDTDQNVQFSLSAGYLPVKKEANDAELLKKAGAGQKEIVDKMLEVAVETVNTNTMYTATQVINGASVRKTLEYSLSDKAAADRAVVEEEIAAGKTAEEALSAYLTDENFTSWYEEIKEKLETE